MVFNNEGAELFAYISGWEAPCKLNLVANLPIYMTFRYFLSLFDMAYLTWPGFNKNRWGQLSQVRSSQVKWGQIKSDWTG